jgi:Ca-activated chloride channel family protein
MMFKDPWILVLLPVILAALFLKRRNYIRSGFVFPSDEAIKVFGASFKLAAVRDLVYLRLASIALVIIALARPMAVDPSEVKKEGIGIVLAIDCSSTMLAEDINLKLTEQLALMGHGLRASDTELAKAKRKNRIDAAREIAKEFVKDRPDDMIGVVAFGAEAFLVCPMTLDHEWAASSLDRVKGGIVKDGTAIGSAILSSLNQLKKVKAKTRIIVLLTDGINNYGNVSPTIAAQAARSIGVKIYTIGIVSGSSVPYPVKDEYGRITYRSVKIEINEDVLKKMAELTGGKYFKATDMKSLKDSYSEIDKLEKTGLEEKRFDDYKDVFPQFAALALAFLILEILLANTILRKIP